MGYRLFILWLLCFLANSSYAVEYLSPEQTLKAQSIDSGNLSVKDQIVGKTFWYIPSQLSSESGYFRLKFRDTYDVRQGNLFTPSEAVSFQVVDIKEITYKPDDYKVQSYKVLFADGKEGFIQTTDFSAAIFRRGLTDANRDFISEKSPEQVIATQKKLKEVNNKKTKKLAEELKAKGGVRLGMTKQEILESNWGSPKHINKTTGSSGIHEQWVYGGNNYLYLENGILTSIQN